MRNIVSIIFIAFLIFFPLKSFAEENDKNFIDNRALISENYFNFKKDLLKSKVFNNLILKIDNLFLNISIEKLKEINSILKKVDENEDKYSKLRSIIIYLKLKIKFELINKEIIKQKIIPNFIKNENYLKIENNILYCEFGDKNDKSPQVGVYYSKQKISVVENPYLLEEINYSFLKDDKFIYRYSTICTESVPGNCSCDFSKTDLDLDSFELLDEYFYKDKNNLYHFGDKVEGIDLASFEFIRDKNGETSYYIKDKNNIFYGENKILGANIETFIFLKGEFLGKKYDAKDKDNYYKYGKKINFSSFDIRIRAVDLGNILFCERLEEDSKIKSCKEFVSNSFTKKAVQNDDISLCELTLDKNYCIDKVNYNLAINKKDISFCKKIKGENKERCFFELSANGGCDYITTENYKARCIKIKENIRIKDIYNEAIDKNIVEKCIYLHKYSNYYNKCMKTILVNSKDLDSCYRYFTFGDKVLGVTCYVNLAIEKNNIDICKKIENKFYSDMCIGDFNRFKTK